MNKFTQKQWHIQRYKNGRHFHIETHGFLGNTIARVEPGEEAEANAYLIEAAPELYRTLKAVYADIELQNVEGGSDELNFLVHQILALVER